MLGNLTRLAVRRLVRLYYPRIEVSNPERIPQGGPVLLCANHPNSVIDAAIVGIAARRPVRFLAKAPLFDVPVFGSVIRALGMLPAYRESDDPSQVGKNVDTLGAGADVLLSGQALGIFPEGKTHDADKVELVRSGAARIAMQATVRGCPGLKIVPLGIAYEDKERFRSSIWVRVGEPIDAAQWLAAHGNEERPAMRALTKELDKRMKDLAVHLNEQAWADLLPDLEVLVPPAAQTSTSFLSPLRQRKRIADAMNYFQAADKPKADAAAEEIRKLRARHANLGLNLRAPLLRLEPGVAAARLIFEPVWLLLWLLPAMLGTLHHLVPFLLVRMIAPKLQTPGRTTVSFARLALGIPLYAGWYALLWWWWVVHWHFNATVVAAYFACMPFCGIVALNYWRRARAAAALWGHEVRLALRREDLNALRQARVSIRLRLQEMAAEFARLFPPEAPPVQMGKPRWRWPARVAAALILSGLLGLAVYWRDSWQRTPELRGTGPSLQHARSEVLRERLAADDQALLSVLGGLRETEARALRLKEDFASGKRSYYKQADNDETRRLLQIYMGHRAALLRTVYRWRNAEQISDEHLRLHAFLDGYTAAAALWEHSLKLVVLWGESPETVKKLNEAEPLWDIPDGLYDEIRANLARRENRRLMAQAQARYETLRGDFAKHGLAGKEPFDAFHAAIASSQKTNDELGRSLWKEKFSMTVDEAEELAKTAMYQAQSLIATWIGDTKIREPREGQTLINPEALAELRAKLQPGDILLERRNWFLSNAFLPGYWPHAALYVGTPEDLQRLGLDKDPRVAKHWEEFCQNDHDGHHHVIVEALSEGVVCATLEHSIGGGDAVAVLRPRLPPEAIKQAIAEGFSHLGKAYDFEFDFFSTDKIVCTELVFRAYAKKDGKPGVDFALVDVMGRKTLPAIEMVRKFAQERGKESAEMDFIAFLDGDEATGQCQACDEEQFVQTLERPGMTWLQRKK